MCFDVVDVISFFVLFCLILPFLSFFVNVVMFCCVLILFSFLDFYTFSFDRVFLVFFVSKNGLEC